jgi:hypothetical protein
MWRFAKAMVEGPSHAKTGTPCEDFCFVETVPNAAGQDVLIAGISDGAAGAKHAALAAETACASLRDTLTSWSTGIRSVSEAGPPDARAWVQRVHDAIRAHARTEGELIEYWCTLLFVVADSDQALIGQVGDGAIVVGDGQAYRPVFWPGSDNPNNETYFVSEPDVSDHLWVEVLHERPRDIALFSDGLEPIVLRYKDRTARSSIFRTVFSQLHREPPGCSTTLNRELERFLRSDAVVAHTYDDRTLIVATRGPEQDSGARVDLCTRHVRTR